MRNATNAANAMVVGGEGDDGDDGTHGGGDDEKAERAIFVPPIYCIPIYRSERQPAFARKHKKFKVT